MSLHQKSKGYRGGPASPRSSQRGCNVFQEPMASVTVGWKYGDFIRGNDCEGPFNVPCIIPGGAVGVRADVWSGAFQCDASSSASIPGLCRRWLESNCLDLSVAGSFTTTVIQPAVQNSSVASSEAAALLLAYSRFHRLPIDPHLLFVLMWEGFRELGFGYRPSPVHLAGQLVLCRPDSCRLKILGQMPSLVLIELLDLEEANSKELSTFKPRINSSKPNEHGIFQQRALSVSREMLMRVVRGELSEMLSSTVLSATHGDCVPRTKGLLCLASKLAEEHQAGLVEPCDSEGIAIAVPVGRGLEPVIAIADAAAANGLRVRYAQTGLAG